MRTFLRSLAAAIIVPVVATAQADDLATIVARFYPSSLDADTAAIAAGQANTRHQCWVVLRAEAGGQPSVVLAAYTNSQSAVVRVLTRDGSGFILADQAAGAAIAGSTCRAEPVDVDGDGMPEAVVRLGAGTGSGTNDWIYAWRDGALADLSPLTATGVPIAVGDSEFVDLDGDGMLELRSGTRRFRLSAGGYVPAP